MVSKNKKWAWKQTLIQPIIIFKNIRIYNMLYNMYIIWNKKKSY